MPQWSRGHRGLFNKVPNSHYDRPNVRWLLLLLQAPPPTLSRHVLRHVPAVTEVQGAHHLFVQLSKLFYEFQAYAVRDRN